MSYLTSKVQLFVVLILIQLIKAFNEMTLIASELNGDAQGSVKIEDLDKWFVQSTKGVGTQVSKVQKWSQNSFGPLGQFNTASRRIEVFNLDVLMGYTGIAFTPNDSLKINIDATNADDMIFSPYDGQQQFNEITSSANVTHTVENVMVVTTCNFKVPSTDQYFYIRKFMLWMIPCHASCYLCKPDDPNECTQCPSFADQVDKLCKCQNSYFMHQNKCVTSCPADFTPDAINRVCLKNVQNCATAKDITSCEVCSSNYYLNTVDLQCYSSCPMGLEASQTPKWTCSPYEKKLSASEGYLIFSLFDRPWASKKELELKGVNIVQCDTCTHPKNNFYDWCGEEKIFGGYGRQTTVALSKTIDTVSHFRYRFYVKLFLIDDWTKGGSVSITVGTDVYTYSFSDCAKGELLCGDTGKSDCVIIVDKTAPHKDQQIPLKIVSTITQKSTDQSFGFNNLYLAVEGCTLNCQDCEFGNGTNKCTKCIAGYYLHDVDKKCYKDCPDGYYNGVTNGINVCLACDIQCGSCSGKTSNCTKCAFNRINIPTCNCPDGYFSKNGNTAKCEQCSFRCSKCVNDENNCTECSPTRDQTTKPLCTCQINTYEEINQPACKNCFSLCSKCTGPNKSQCTECKSPTRNPKKDCDCGDGYYGDDSTLHCAACDSKCGKCKGAGSSICETCPPAGNAPPNTMARILSLSGTECNCPEGSYDDGKAYCPVCNYKCKKCTGPTSSQTDCQVCQKDRLLSTNCGCITGFDIQNQAECSNCPAQCKTCDSNQVCIDCSSDTTRDAAPKCLCKAGYYDKKTPECVPCLSKCETCDNATQCTRCKSDRDPPNCDCASGSYSDGNGVCQTCHQNCASCFGEESFQCIQCSPNRLKPPFCTCPQGTFSIPKQVMCPKCHSSCLQCDGPNENNCTDCDTSNRLFLNKQCVCKVGYFKNIFGECQQCGPYCAECESLLICNKCRGNRVGDNCACPSGFFDTSLDLCPQCDKKCTECITTSINCTVCAINRQNEPTCSCSKGYFEVSATKRCDACQWQCSSCLSSPDKCATCRGDRTAIQATNDCICGDYTFEDYVSENCAKCHRSCKKCSGSLESNCTLCRESYNRDSFNNCVCPSNTYEDLSDMRCKLCHSSCKRCGGPSELECIECAIGYNQIKGYCTKNEQTSGICSSLCLTCDTNYLCTACVDSKRQLVNGKCLCLGGTYDQNNACFNCDSSCLQCNGSQINQCTSCRRGHILSNGRCVTDVTDQKSEHLLQGLIIGFSILGGLILIFLLYKVIRYYIDKQAATHQYVYEDSNQIEDLSQIEYQNKQQGQDNLPQNQQMYDSHRLNILQSSKINQPPQQFQNDYMRYSYKQ